MARLVNRRQGTCSAEPAAAEDRPQAVLQSHRSTAPNGVRELPKTAYILYPTYEGAFDRKSARDHRRSKDRPGAYPDDSARRSACHHGAQRFWQEHAGKGPGGAPGLPGHSWQGVYGWGESARNGDRPKS